MALDFSIGWKRIPILDALLGLRNMDVKRSVIVDWSARYGKRHQLQRIQDFPLGIVGPKKVRIYFRLDHYVLQWWEPSKRTNLSDRVEGDLVAAINRARQIEERLVNFRTSMVRRPGRLSHRELVERFQLDLARRADAGEIDPGTVSRYGSALSHYLSFCECPLSGKSCSFAAAVNREFRLAFVAFLEQRSVSANGRSLTSRRPMRGSSFVLDAVRGMYQWAADPDRANLLPEGFRNPFLRSSESRGHQHADPLSEPDITLPMAIDLIRICDAFQLRLFVCMLLFGLRAAEPCYLFVEYMSDDWLQVPCIPDLDVKTKGRRDKRFPLLPELKEFWEMLRDSRPHGLLFERRIPKGGSSRPSLRGSSLADLIEEYRHIRETASSSNERLRQLNAILMKAGALNYDLIENEFSILANRLGWPKKATLKDLRHLFATTMNNAAMPEGYRRYLMGHSPGKAALVSYTHLNELQRHYFDAMRREWSSVIAAVQRRIGELKVSTL